MNDQTVTILRTGKLYVFDMAVDLFKKAGIPHFTGEETSSGLRVALPAAPSGEPGTWWTIRVPSDYVGEAKELLESMPFPTGINPDVWDYASDAKPLTRAWRTGLLAFLVVAAGWMIYHSIRASM